MAEPKKCRRGGHLRVGLDWEVDRIDPPASFGGWNTARVVQQMFESLVEDDLTREDGEYTNIVPTLAESYEISPDGGEFTFHLRQNVVFHDGYKLDAAAVRFNIERSWDQRADHYFSVSADFNRVGYEALAKVTVVDDLTIRLVMREPFAEFLRYMTQEDAPGSFVCISPGSVKQYGNEGVADHAAGTGPFVLKQRFDTQHGSGVTIERFDGYWGETSCLDEISFFPIPDAEERALALETGKVDLVYGPEPTRLRSLEDQGFVVREGPIPYVWYFILNTREKPLDDVRVRQAIALALDREGLSKQLFANNAVVTKGIVPPACPSYESDFPDLYTYNPERAAHLLKEAGQAGGFTLKVLTASAGSAQLDPLGICEWLRRDLAKVAITVELIVRDDWVSYCDEWRQGMPQGVGASEMSWGMSCDIWLEQILHSKNISPRGFNAGYYARAEVDELFDVARREVDELRRRTLYRKIHRLIMEDAPVVPVVTVNRGMVVHSDQVMNFRFPRQNWHDLKNIWLKE